MKYGYIFVPESFRKDKDFLARTKEELDVDEMRIEYGENVTQRPEFDDIMSTIKEGDIIVTRNICHLSHTGKNFISLLANLQALKIDLVVTEQGIDTRDSINLFANVFKAAEDLDKDYLRKRQAEGIALAKANGVYKGRKPIDIDETLLKETMDAWMKDEITAVEAMNKLHLKPSTFYRKIKALGYIKEKVPRFNQMTWIPDDNDAPPIEEYYEDEIPVQEKEIPDTIPELLYLKYENIKNKFLKVFDALDAIRNLPRNANKRCYMAYNIVLSIIKHYLNNCDNSNYFNYDEDAIHYSNTITPFYIWRMCKKIYQFDNDLADMVKHLEVNKLDMDPNMFERLPYLGMCIIAIVNDEEKAIFVCLDKRPVDDYKCIYFYSLDIDVLKEELSKDTVFTAPIKYYLPLIKGKTIEECIKIGVERNHDPIEEYYAESREDHIHQFTNLLMYILAKNADISKHKKFIRSINNSKPTIEQVDIDYKLDEYHEDLADVMHVGITIGDRIRENATMLESIGTKRGHRVGVEGSHKSKIPHVRKAHWHGYWCKNKRTGERQLVMKWVAAIIVNGMQAKNINLSSISN